MSKEEYIIRLGMLEQEAAGLQQQIQIIEQQILELHSLQIGLEELEKSKEKKILANLGKGIFIKSEILDKDLFVDVGERSFVKKTIPETLDIIEEQLEKLMKAKNKVLDKMQHLREEMEKLIGEAQKDK